MRLAGGAKAGLAVLATLVAAVPALGMVSTPVSSRGPEVGVAPAISSLLRGMRLAPLPAAAPATAAPVFESEDGDLITVDRIRAFLDRRSSPLAPHALEIVSAGARFGVDPRVVVAISGVESGYGARAFGYNAWGWGKRRWSTWTEAIHEFTAGIASGYRSLRTGRFHRASRTYCPPCGSRWGVVTAQIFRAI